MTIPRSRDLRLLAGAAGVSALGDFLALIPLVLHVQERTGSTFAVSAVFFALWAPVVLGAGLAGTIVDSFENRALLVGVSFAQAAIAVALALCVNALWAVLPLVALLGFTVAVSQPAEFALVPAAAGDVEIARANGLMETVRAVGFTAGPLLGGVLGAAGMLRLALAIDALSFVAVGFAGLALRARRRPAAATAPGERIRARAGFAFLVHDRALALTLGGAIAALTVFTISVTAEPFFVTDVLGAGSFGYGLLITAWTLGMLIGAAGLPQRVPAAAVAVAALTAIVAQGLGLVVAALAPVLWTALLGFAFGGVAHGLKNVLLRTLIHERVPEALRGRAFAAYNGARNGAELGALALGGLVVGAFGARTGLLVSGLGPAAIGLTCLLYLTTTLQRRTFHARVQG
ncbi:MFS transporter [Solirubrobacter ginsenosidimutans]|uniref:MFS transporter n=1 Tax=Solirubrobacter ginsenosidimutans TaxID=490573 RepID=A0A9X3S208_9ACTN|nr:MFS transporter [Solirubrobacter ginsenosidimutans]MDA0161672.1 MFS transporter [Solirubrobacter ginsenosidimutans]